MLVEQYLLDFPFDDEDDPKLDYHGVSFETRYYWWSTGISKFNYYYGEEEGDGFGMGESADTFGGGWGGI